MLTQTPAQTSPSAPSLRPVSGPSAWIGEDLLRSEAWIYTLTAAEVAEMEAAADAMPAAGAEWIGMGRGQFPLPSLGPVLEGMRSELLHGRGFVLMRGLPVEGYSIERAAAIFWGIGAHFGKARSQNGKGHLLGHVRDLDFDLTEPTVRVYQTRERQTYHTDSCDIVALMCLQTAKQGGLSSLASSMTVYNEMLARHPDLLPCLFEPMAVDRREEVPDGHKPYFTTPVYHEHEGHLSAIYARRYIESAQRFPDAPRLTARHREAMDLLDALAEDERLHLDMELRRGDMQWVHNHTVFHDRTAYEDWPQPERKRHLLRLWLCPPDGRPLPSDYADRYGGVEIGNRGGIVVPGMDFTVPLTPQ